MTTLILALLPTILKLTSFYLNTAQNNEDIQFEFFRRDLLKEKMTSKNNYEIENAYTIKLKKNKDVIRYIYKNRKIYKNINQRGNITLLNHVLSTRILKTNDNIVKLLITTGEANDEHKEIFFYSQKAFVSLYLIVIFSIYLSIISFYISQYSLKLKTIHNLDVYYNKVIVNKLKEVD
ncbi:hypothetical protein D0401_08985 [Staphylococcus epidermidis]|nr:hypothetical protein [Staphylococcus epidermidis]